MKDVRELTIEISGMTCDHCERSVSKALQSVPGIKEVLQVSHAGALARVTAGPEATPHRIERAVAKAGYRARVMEEAQNPEAPAVSSERGNQFDLVIVGGGSAGFAAAIKALRRPASPSRKLDGVFSATVTLLDSLGIVRYDPQKLTPRQIAAHLIALTGYGARVLPDSVKAGPR